MSLIVRSKMFALPCGCCYGVESIVTSDGGNFVLGERVGEPIDDIETAVFAKDLMHAEMVQRLNFAVAYFEKQIMSDVESARLTVPGFRRNEV